MFFGFWFMQSNGYKEINTLSTNIANMAKSGDKRYDAPFIYFCLNRFSELYGQSIRYLMCKFILDGIKGNVEYAGQMEGLRKEFNEENSK